MFGCRADLESQPNVPLHSLGRSAEREGQVECKRWLGAPH